MRSFAALALFVSCLCVIAAPGRAVAGAWTQVVPDAGHFVWIEQPDAVGAGLTRLLGLTPC